MGEGREWGILYISGTLVMGEGSVTLNATVSVAAASLRHTDAHPHTYTASIFLLLSMLAMLDLSPHSLLLIILGSRRFLEFSCFASRFFGGMSLDRIMSVVVFLQALIL